MRTLPQLRLILAEMLEDKVKPLFKDQANTRVAVIIRNTTNPEMDVLVTDDSLDELIQVIERSKPRKTIT